MTSHHFFTPYLLEAMLDSAHSQGVGMTQDHEYPELVTGNHHRGAYHTWYWCHKDNLLAICMDVSIYENNLNNNLFQ